MNLPSFKYSPNAYTNGSVFVLSTNPGELCDCCGKHAPYFYEGGLYCEADVDLLCPDCIATGEAAVKFDGEFQNALTEDLSAEKVNELQHKTPGFTTWQGEVWLTHCADYCAFIGDIGFDELKQMPDFKEILKDYYDEFGDEMTIELETLEGMEKSGPIAGYLFECLHCGKHRLWVDAD